jgi:hypothetical protein
MESILIILIFGIAFFPIILLIDEISKDMRTKQPKKEKYNIQDEVHMVYEAMWVEKVIKSCKTYKQLIASRKLYRALSDKYNNKVDSNLLYRIDNNLYLVWYEMTDQVTYD